MKRFGTVFGVTRQGRTGGFTLIELLVVISIIGVLASMVVGLGAIASRRSKETRVRAELNQLVTLIEAYHAKVGSYPPDNSRNGRNVNVATNQLYYELSGTYLDAAGAFNTAGRTERITPALINTYFRAEGFANSARTENGIPFTAQFKASQYGELPYAGVDIEVLRVPVDWPASAANPPFPGGTDTGKPKINPWRYVSTAPTNNPTKFDLWAEFIVGGKRLVIANWTRETLLIEP